MTVATRRNQSEQMNSPSEKPEGSEPQGGPSELIPRRNGVQGGWRGQGLGVLGIAVDVTLLLGLPGMGPVPVSGHCLVVPDGRGLRVTQVPWLARVVCGVDE